jgi:hypothetical protein
MKKRIITILRKTAIYAVLFALALYTFPVWWCSREADAWFDGDMELSCALADSMKKWVDEPLSRGNFSTGSKQFDGEWLFGTYMMAGMGFGQMILEHPETRGEYLPVMESCIRKIMTPEVRAFDKERWGGDPLDDLGSGAHHCAYLGYFNLLLSLRESVAPNSEFSRLNGEITKHLIENLKTSSIGLLKSYPGEVYPVDNCAVLASIALHYKATRQTPPPLLEKFFAKFAERSVDSKTNLLHQCLDPATGEPADHPRGSGTTLGLYMLSFAGADLARKLFIGVKKELASSLFRFGGIREYPKGVDGLLGDIDSGPVVFGFGASATGFGLSGARIFGDRALFKKLCATLNLLGAPAETDGKLHFISGGPIGNAIMFAMLTAGKRVTRRGRLE